MRISTALIGPHEHQLQELETLTGRLGDSVSIGRRVGYYPAPGELERMLRAVDPDVLFLSTAERSLMEMTVEHAARTLPQLQVVLLDSDLHQETLRTAMQLGVRECLTHPFQMDDLRGALERSMTRRASHSAANGTQNALYSFFPAKAGVGATTLAVQCALNLPTDPSHRALLLDADLDAGIVKFLLQIRNPHSFTDALERVEQLDENLWPQLVSDFGPLDVLHAGDSGSEYRIDLNRLQHVLASARRQYATLIADLPSALNRLSVELMNQSKMIFLVTTPEIASMHLARTRLRQLQDLQFGSQVRLIVNRVEKKSAITPEQIANNFGIPVHFTFANDYVEVQNACLSGKHVSPTSPLGRQLTPFAESLGKANVTASVPKKRRFLEVFSLPR